MSHPNKDSNSWAAKGVKNTVHLGYWTAAWLLTLALAKFGPETIWQSNTVLTALAILVNIGVGYGMIMANKRHLKGLDEMQQKIQLEAMALSLGVGLVAGFAYSNLEVANLIPFNADISHVIILMALTYLAGMFFGIRKFR